MIFAAARLRLKLGWDFGLNSGTKHAARGNSVKTLLLSADTDCTFPGSPSTLGALPHHLPAITPYHLPATTQLHLLPAIAKPLFPL